MPNLIDADLRIAVMSKAIAILKQLHDALEQLLVFIFQGEAADSRNAFVKEGRNRNRSRTDDRRLRVRQQGTYESHAPGSSMTCGNAPLHTSTRTRSRRSGTCSTSVKNRAAHHPVVAVKRSRCSA